MARHVSPDAPARWQAPAASGPVTAEVRVPGSKSLTNRYLLLAAAADADSVIRNALDSRDTRLMAEALSALGAGVSPEADGTLRITPLPLTRETGADGEPTAEARVDCGLAGTVMRFVPPLAAATGRRVRFDGDEQAYTRPMSTILDALERLGADVSSEHGTLPFTVHAPAGMRGGHIELDASASSQFVSGLLLSGGLCDLGVELVHTGASLPSRPHIDMTLEVLADAGVHVSEPESGRWVVEPGRPRALDVTVEPDLSNAAAFLGAALVTGGSVRIPHWPIHTTQAGDRFRQIAEAFGGSCALDRSGLTVQGPERLEAVDLDMSEVGELTPVTAAVAAFAPGTSVLRGIGHLRGHETDRLSALAAEFARVGVEVAEGPDSLAITGSLTAAAAGSTPAAGARELPWRTYADHRMVMAGAIVALGAPGLEIDDPGTVGKTMPAFPELWTESVGS
ncbi:3-phosphoshikimate 1-carboxyvinyltransferase [Brevibacterium album]|uniref:3-phosphoshikimate 1-carboxyvinyltransferase n=1 Tax=Brevibacterium album TaxID=417948 RepID=UPI00042501CE|nr:3-phosphoshikimate 1-carboxyvinyltransferase [Brevibacterium album]